MRNIITTLVLIFINSITLNVFGHENNFLNQEYVNGEVIVKYKYSEFLTDQLNYNTPTCDYRKQLQQNSEKLLNDNGFVIKDKIQLDTGKIALLEFDNKKDLKYIIDLLRTDTNVIIAEPNYINKGANTLGTNDFFGDEQRGLKYISRPTAYKQYKSSLEKGAQTIVGVIDAGVNYNHVDLKSSMWTPNNCKFQGKGISCQHGYDFYNSHSTPLPIGDNHGTHIAGIIAATANNFKGMVGVNPYTKIAALKVTKDYEDISSNFDDFSILKAIDFSIENGIKIINASYGGHNYSEVMEAKIKEYGENGGIFVTTAMNEGINIDNEGNAIYPCSYNLDNIICVTAINSDGLKPSFANYGSKSVDIAAPGEEILGTISNVRDMYSYFEDFSTCNNGWYGGNCLNASYQFSQTISSPTYHINTSPTSVLKFNAQCFGEASTLQVSIYNNGSYESNTNIGNVTNFQNEYKIIIPSGISSFSFKIDKEGNGTCNIDNVGIYPIQYYGGESDTYDLWKGTSMATPFVAGLASLIRTLNPGITPAQVIRLIIENGDYNSSLQGKTVSGKTINIKKTLDAVNITARNGNNAVNTTNYYINQGNNYSNNDFVNIDDFMDEMFGNNSHYNGGFEYTDEMQEAFNYAKNYGLTTASTIDSADMDGYLTRISMAKILSQFAINALGLQPSTTRSPSFYDVSDSLNTQFDNGVNLAYQLGIMGINTHYFRPYDYVTRAEFATAISRMVYHTADGGNGNAYYEPHLYKLRNEGILTNIDPFRIEKRGLALVILKRLSDNLNH